MVRHYLRLSHLNYCVDDGLLSPGLLHDEVQPEGNEAAARLPGFARLHPLQDPSTAQGAMALMFGLQQMIAEIGGFHAREPPAFRGRARGAHRHPHHARLARRPRRQRRRTRILVPDSAHGTNPASTAMAGLEVVEIPSDRRGNVDLLPPAGAAWTIASPGLMLTNPNTLGLFEENLLEITRLVHEAGGLVYGDGANFNAILGVAKPGPMGIDVMHFNLHKTFSTPHGGGGPGCGRGGGGGDAGRLSAGARGCPDEGVPARGAALRVAHARAIHRPGEELPRQLRRARARLHVHPHARRRTGLRAVAENAVLNANYLQARLKDTYPVPHGDRTCMHEFVAQGKIAEAPDIRALDISKRLIDYGFHPPTNYFPLIVPEALMIEPTETESMETLDKFADALLEIAQEASTHPELLHEAPHSSPVRRLDEVRAARELKVTAG